MYTSLPQIAGSIPAVAGMPQPRPAPRSVVTSSAGGRSQPEQHAKLGTKIANVLDDTSDNDESEDGKAISARLPKESQGGESRARAKSGKGKEKGIDNSPPLEPKPRRMGRPRGFTRNERPTKLVAIAPRSGHKPDQAAEPRPSRTTLQFSTSGGDSRRSVLCPAITEDQELKILAEKYRNPRAKHVDIANSVGGGITVTDVGNLMVTVNESTRGKDRVEPRRRHISEAELDTIVGYHNAGEPVEIVARNVHRTVEDVTCTLDFVRSQRGLGPVQDKP